MPRHHPTAFDPETLLAHGDFLRALARGLVADPLRADDVVQDTWLAALSKPPRPGSRVRAWLAVVARNFALQAGRRDGRARDREVRCARAERVPSTADIVEREALRRAVVEALSEIAEPYRSVLVLRYYEGLAPRAIAARLALPVETVRTRIKRGLEHLRRRLDAQHDGGSAVWSAALVALANAPRTRAAEALLSTKKLAAAAVICLSGAGAWIALRPAPPAPEAHTVAAAPQAPELPDSRSEPRNDPRPPVQAERATPPAAAQALPAATTIAVRRRDLRLTLQLQERQVVGVVIDARNAPILGALVFGGNAIRARGDEPFKPFQPERIEDGVLTDAAGQFLLSGRAREVTAWHERYGAVTVRWEDARTVVLPDKGELRGRFLDREGRPVAGLKVFLDRERETVSDPEGEFAFAGVERGVRGLQVERVPEETLPGGLRRRRQGPWFGVRFEGAGAEPFEIVIDAASVELALTSGEKPFEEPLDCFPIGLGRVFALPAEPVRARAGAVAFEGLLEGPHFLVAPSGEAARFEVGGQRRRESVELGTAALTVRARRGTQLYLVPAGADEFVQLMAGRIASRTVPDTGELRWEPLEAGRWALGIDREGIVAEIAVEGAGSTFVLE